MNNRVLRVLIVILVLVVMPVLSAYIIAKLFVEHKETPLIIIFISLIVLSVALSVIKFIKYNKNKE